MLRIVWPQATHSATTVAKTAVELAIVSRFDIKTKLGSENFAPLHKTLSRRPTDEELHAMCVTKARWQVYRGRVVKDIRGNMVSTPHVRPCSTHLTCVRCTHLFTWPGNQVNRKHKFEQRETKLVRQPSYGAAGLHTLLGQKAPPSPMHPGPLSTRRPVSRGDTPGSRLRSLVLG